MSTKKVPEAYTIKETAEILRVSGMTITRQIDAGAIPAIQIGVCRVVPRTYIDQLFAETGFPRVDQDKEKKEE